MPILTVLGGRAGADRLAGILTLPKQTVGGRPAYSDIFAKAAVLFRSLILDHPFLDGNKRMGTAAAIVFLHTNGYIICAAGVELFDLAISVASGEEKSVPRLRHWFEERTLSAYDLSDAVARGSLEELVRQLPGDYGIDERPLLKAEVA